MKNTILLTVIILLISCNATNPIKITSSNKWSETQKNGYNLITNEGGQTLGYAPTSGVKILTEAGFAFKDLNKNGILDKFEDWRLSADERAEDLAKKISIEQIAGLMLYSSHQSIPAGGRRSANYGGKPYAESGALPSDLSDDQKKFLTEDNLRHVLITSVETPAIAAQWNNNAQAHVEGIGFGIPVNTSSDPRHGSDSYAEYNEGAGGSISMWPGTMGIAATFDPSLMKKFGEIASKEYRALGIATALSPQIDLATEPRWSRFDGTMGEDPDLATDLARAYVDGFQSTNGGDWGFESVNAMVKHWPGGGPEEGGRDGHFGYGAYAVYPGKNFKDHIQPFTEGAFKLEGATKMASAVMPYYTISTGHGEAVANGFNKYLITDVLRGEYGYDGVLCTDWGITRDVSTIEKFEGKPWGVENMTENERHYKAIEAGMDQFGGNNDIKPVIASYKMGVEEHGEAYMRKRFEASAVRLLKNIFRVGLFENPYLDIEETKAIVGNSEFMKAGFDAQLRSIVLLKNQSNTLPIKTKKKVYVPQRYIAPSTNWWGMVSPEKMEDSFNKKVASKYFELVDSPEAADFALVGIQSPNGGVGYDKSDLEKGGNGYMPISLQYGSYTAETAREVSLAGGSPLEDFTNRSYRGKTVKTINATDMDLVNDTKKKMGNKPVIVTVNVSKPMIFSEIEGSANAILVHMGVQDQALMEIISGVVEPSALLPFQMPKDMATVEAQFEDVPRDMVAYTDSEGNQYDFGFGMNWNGMIKDQRVSQYANAMSNVQNSQVGTYTVVVEGYDWGPAASKVILPLDETVSNVQKEDYYITATKKAACMDINMEATNGERTILYAYISDEKGNRVVEGNHLTLVLLVAPNLDISSPMQYVPKCRGNIWADYTMTIKNKSTNQIWGKETARIHPIVDEFDVSGKFVYNDDITLSYADYTPTTQQAKHPLIIWLHGGGEGGTDPTIPLMANRAANYASPEIQAYFGGAYVLVPQSPTFWMDSGKGEYTRGNVNDKYNESLMALIKDYVAKHQNIDKEKIYVGGCSNGGYMSLKLMILHPDYFAASFPSALAYQAEYVTDKQIDSIKDIPIWFIHSKDDPVTKAEETVVPVYEKLIAAGAKNVHFSFYDHVVDITGFYGGDDYHYMGHFSWIYSHANVCKLDYDGQPVMLNGKPTNLMEWLAAQKKIND